MLHLLNAVRAQASVLDAAAAQPRFGIVSSVDPATYTARVLLQPENVLSGWLPILTPWAGANWGLACPPTPGQQVLVVAQEGEAEHGVILGLAFSNQSRPPPAPSGELWLVHASGSSIRLLQNGAIEIQASTLSFSAPVTMSGNVEISGNLSVTGTISDTSGSLGAEAGS